MDAMGFGVMDGAAYKCQETGVRGSWYAIG